jgi:hypothetical protein
VLKHTSTLKSWNLKDPRDSRDHGKTAQGMHDTQSSHTRKKGDTRNMHMLTLQDTICTPQVSWGLVTLHMVSLGRTR